MVKNCLQCKREFSTFPSTIKKGHGKFCSQECHYSSRNGRKTKNCVQCKKKFETYISATKRGGGRFCSLACLHLSFKNGVKIKCFQCSSVFYRVPSYFKGGKNFCSPFCQQKNQISKIKVSCKECGNKFETVQSLLQKGKANFCSLQCVNDNPEVRKKKSDSMKGKKHPWSLGEKSHFWKGGITPMNMKIRSSSDYRLWREAVFKRDTFTCKECGDDRGGNLNAHHIKPFAFFPELRLA